MCVDTVQKVDFITQLPQELIEDIVSNLEGEDILTCLEVSKEWKSIIDEECVWRRLCLDRSWLLKQGSEIKTWRDLYWLNKNWREGLYVRYKLCDEDLRNCTSHTFNITYFANFTSLESDGEFLLVPRLDGINVWDVKSTAVIHQRIQNSLCSGCNNFDTKVNHEYIIYVTGSYIQVFKKNQCTKLYSRIKVLYLVNDGFYENSVIEYDSCDEMTMYNHDILYRIVLGENHFAVVKDRNILYWTLRPWEYKPPISIQNPGIVIIDIKIASHYLVIVERNTVNYSVSICVFDLVEREWRLRLSPLNPDNAVDTVHPLVVANSLLLVGIYPYNFNTTVLRVWNYRGEILRTTVLPKEIYNQCCLVDDIVIYTSAINKVTVWSSKSNSVLNEFSMYNVIRFTNCPANLMLVTLYNSVEVWDWKKGAKLYSINDETHLCYMRILNNYHYATLSLEMNDISPHIDVLYYGNNILKQ